MTKKEIHFQFVEYGKNAKEWLRNCAFLLPEIYRQKIWRDEGFTSIYHYAAELANMSRYQVELALWTLDKIKHMPALLKVAKEKGIHVVRILANVATPATAEFWAEKARIMSKHALEAYVQEFRWNGQSESCPGTRRRATVAMELESEVVEKLKAIKGDKDWNSLMKELLELAHKNAVANPKPLKPKPAPVHTDSRHIPNPMQSYVRERTGMLCAYPGCTKPPFQLHHTQRWMLDKTHDPDLIQSLCKTHNELAHLGLIYNEEGSPKTWRLLQEPDRTSPKWRVDQQVLAHRGR